MKESKCAFRSGEPRSCRWIGTERQIFGIVRVAGEGLSVSFAFQKKKAPIKRLRHCKTSWYFNFILRLPVLDNGRPHRQAQIKEYSRVRPKRTNKRGLNFGLAECPGSWRERIPVSKKRRTPAAYSLSPVRFLRLFIFWLFTCHIRFLPSQGNRTDRFQRHHNDIAELVNLDGRFFSGRFTDPFD